MVPRISILHPFRDRPEIGRNPADARFSSGKHGWTIQTYEHLRAHGLEAAIVARPPEDGIIVAHRSALGFWRIPGPRQMLVCVTADWPAHPWAQLQIVQNASDSLRSWGDAWRTHVLPFWPQPGLLPRDPERGARLENVVYLGRKRWLAPEMRSAAFASAVTGLGLGFAIAPLDAFHDYRSVDVTLAVRSFDDQRHDTKPASKLVNAWRAGVPAVLGAESAYRALRKSALDYVEVGSVAETIAALTRLRDDPALRAAMIENGLRRATEFAAPSISQQWIRMLTGPAVSLYEDWCRDGVNARAAFLARRSIELPRLFSRRRSVPR